MDKIASFQIDHLRLKPGVYVSRKDKFSDVTITTFDLRFKEPNKEPVMDQPALHTIEHLAATFLRSNKDWSSKVVYFGPMGCRTGFYLILEGEYTSRDILPLLLELLNWVKDFKGDIPGASAEECGNWRDQNIEMAKWECNRYADIIRPGKEGNFEYPSVMY